MLSKIASPATSVSSFLSTRFLEVSGKRFAIDRTWEWQAKRRFRSFIRRNRTQCEAKTCVVVGNGPSLNDTDLACLEGADVFISNFAFEHPKLIAEAKYLVIVNHLVAEQARPRLEKLLGEMSLRAPKLDSVLIPTHLRALMPDNEYLQYFEAATTTAFQTEPDAGGSCQSTVTYFLMQLAYWLGYDRVVLIGVDNTYVQPADAEEGTVLLQEGADPNHFSASYFSGMLWQAADPYRMSAVYELAKAAYRSAGKQIINCTVGGALEAYPRGDLAETLSKAVVQIEHPGVAKKGAAGYSRVKTLLTKANTPATFGLGLVAGQALAILCAIVFWQPFAPGRLVTASLALCTIIGPVCIAVITHNYICRLSDRIKFDLLVQQAKIDQLHRSNHANN